MPNIKSAIKRVNVAAKKTAENNMQKSALKTTIKKAKEALTNKVEDASSTLSDTMKKIDKAVSSGLLHKNTAARKKSGLQKKLNAVISTK